jgi:glutathione S-transferase
MLIDGDRVITQSWDIVAWADERGRGTRLIPAEHEAAIRAWAEAVDEASSRGRALVVAELLKSPRALDESLPPPIPGWLRPLMRPVTRFGTGRLARKYDLDMGAAAAHELAVRAALESLRARLAGGSYLHRSFTYADIVAATPLQAIAPVADEYLALGPATRVAWTRPALADEFADLLRWRDELYREHRRRAH